MTVAVAAGHRKDIDGLRAIAVLGVILHHAGVSAITAGYAGVDIFFVISGFLIGGIILRDKEAGRFSYRTFYARRARRILPALFFVILCTFPFAWNLMTPEQLRYYGGAAISTLIFLSNVWFYYRVDYFNPQAAEDPLIHTWSLGVEEQFYIALPLIILAVWRFGQRRLVLLLGLLFIASLAAAMVLGQTRPQEAFYMLHTRAWELLAGVFAAMVRRSDFRASAPMSEAASLLGLGLIVGSFFLVPESAAWPGGLTVVPVIGSVLVVTFADRAALARRVLEWHPMVWVGLISYSAYLWHQPILGFLAILNIRLQGVVEVAVFVLATMALAWASWAFVEQPFRHGLAARVSGKLILGAAAVLIAAFAIGGHVTKGYPARMDAAVLEMLAWQNAVPETYRRCIGGRREGERLNPETACVHGAPGVAPEVALWGDSHAAVLAAPLGEALAGQGKAVIELSGSSCMPVSGVRNTALKRAEYCEIHNRLMLDHMVQDQAIKTVIIMGFWNSYVESRDYDNQAGFVERDKLVAVPTGEDIPDDATRIARLTAHMRADLQQLVKAGKRVVLLDPLPEPGFNLPDQLARRLWLGQPTGDVEAFPAAAFEDYSVKARKMLADAAQGLNGVSVVDLSALFCDGAVCHVVADGKPLFFDGNHLSTAGSALVVPQLAKALNLGAERQTSAQP